ncbi:MAG: hypothetical protein CMG74_04285 [Candidatus Marinimicrobia bacterium]|nr:hypothetical protein [Candidatus Neomarinimicrobiota bacterium]|tara:strand:- start:11199 stop:11876 length:678 start_codon:yes stop_codon:yes gene_type:complete
MQYEKTIVSKPWGYEYLVYQNNNIALWYLHIGSGHQTSMHCHPNKTTGLIVLDGEVEISFLGNSFLSKPVSKTMIRKGLFHSTKAISVNGAHIFEIETPVDKHDLVRLEDKYGREGAPYEDSTFEVPKKNDCLWIVEPELDYTLNYNFSNCDIELKTIGDIEYFENQDDEDNIVFLNGGIVTDEGNLVAQAGDVVSCKIIKQLIALFPKVYNNTTIMMISKAKSD